MTASLLCLLNHFLNYVSVSDVLSIYHMNTIYIYKHKGKSALIIVFRPYDCTSIDMSSGIRAASQIKL